MICTSVNPEHIDHWMKELVQNYIQQFQDVCTQFGIDSPLHFDEFLEKVEKEGIMLTFLIWLSGYEEIVCSNAEFKKRFMWQLKKCMELTPSYFQ